MKEKYFAEIDVYDEGMYWQARDEKVLAGQFEKFNQTFKFFESLLTDLELKEGESAKLLANRIGLLLIKKSRADK